MRLDERPGRRPGVGTLPICPHPRLGRGPAGRELSIALGCGGGRCVRRHLAGGLPHAPWQPVKAGRAPNHAHGTPPTMPRRHQPCPGDSHARVRGALAWRHAASDPSQVRGATRRRALIVTRCSRLRESREDSLAHAHAKGWQRAAVPVGCCFRRCGGSKLPVARPTCSRRCHCIRRQSRDPWRNWGRKCGGCRSLVGASPDRTGAIIHSRSSLPLGVTCRASSGRLGGGPARRDSHGR